MAWPPSDSDLPIDITSETDAATGAATQGGSPARPEYVHATVEDVQNEALRHIRDVVAGLGTAATANTTAFDAAGAALAAQTASQPVDSDLTAIAALTTTSFGRSFLALVDAAAGRTLLALGTAATANTTAFDAAGAAAAAQAASQPLDSDLTAIAALTTTSFGRSLLALVDAAALASAHTHAGISPTGPAGGDLTGTYPDPTVGAGKITNSHVAANAAIAGSKLDLTGYQTNIDSVFLGHGAFGIATGSPTVVTVSSGWAGWSHPEAANSSVNAIWKPPPHWNTYKATLYWTDKSATPSGNVRWQLAVAEATVDSAIPASSASLLTAAVGAQNVLKAAAIITSQACNTTKVQVMGVTRIPGDAADTSTNAAVSLGVLLERVT